MIRASTTLTILIVFLNSSIGFTQIQITPEQAKEAIRNAQRVQSLQIDLRTADVLIVSQNELIATLKGEVSNKEMIIALTNKNYKILETQYEVLKAKGDPKYSFNDFLSDAGKILIGIVIGVGVILIL